jgi:hypothetical protein
MLIFVSVCVLDLQYNNECHVMVHWTNQSYSAWALHIWPNIDRGDDYMLIMITSDVNKQVSVLGPVYTVLGSSLGHNPDTRNGCCL